MIHHCERYIKNVNRIIGDSNVITYIFPMRK